MKRSMPKHLLIASLMVVVGWSSTKIAPAESLNVTAQINAVREGGQKSKQAPGANKLAAEPSICAPSFGAIPASAVTSTNLTGIAVPTV